MYYSCSENKDADQLRGYREADLRLCFHPCKLLVFSRTGSVNIVVLENIEETTSISLRLTFRSSCIMCKINHQYSLHSYVQFQMNTVQTKTDSENLFTFRVKIKSTPLHMNTLSTRGPMVL